MTKIRTSCVIQIYYVLVTWSTSALLCRQEQACVAKLDLLEILLDTASMSSFSSDVIASHYWREI